MSRRDLEGNLAFIMITCPDIHDQSSCAKCASKAFDVWSRFLSVSDVLNMGWVENVSAYSSRSILFPFIHLREYC
jgi:hypothetical protein